MNRMIRSGLSILAMLLLVGTAVAQTADPQPVAEPTTDSAEVSPAASGNEAPATAPDSQAATSTPSPAQEPMQESEPLPQTASPLPLIAAVGLLVFGTAVGLAFLRQRAARLRG
jgi:cobalamin biosynthesis Mg chelatase CobN